MKIYRVEHIDSGTGPFWNTSGNGHFRAMHDGNMGRPRPWEDGIKNFQSGNDFIGCKDKEQLHLWFGAYVALLETKNFIVRVFESEHFSIGKHQISFARYKKDIIEEHLLSEFFA